MKKPIFAPNFKLIVRFVLEISMLPLFFFLPSISNFWCIYSKFSTGVAISSIIFLRFNFRASLVFAYAILRPFFSLSYSYALLLTNQSWGLTFYNNRIIFLCPSLNKATVSTIIKIWDLRNKKRNRIETFMIMLCQSSHATSNKTFWALHAQF